VPKERLIACTNCGLAPMRREVAEAKLAALGKGAALAAERYR
jgi:5-methyltetrahydropteroyltriglutamate--homocysteine methyltransferase